MNGATLLGTVLEPSLRRRRDRGGIFVEDLLGVHALRGGAPRSLALQHSGPRRIGSCVASQFSDALLGTALCSTRGSSSEFANVVLPGRACCLGPSPPRPNPHRTDVAAQGGLDRTGGAQSHQFHIDFGRHGRARRDACPRNRHGRDRRRRGRSTRGDRHRDHGREVAAPGYGRHARRHSRSLF